MPFAEPVSAIGQTIVRVARTIKHCLLRLVVNITKVLFAAWGVGAMYYSNLPWWGGRVILAIAFLVFAIDALWRRPNLWRYSLFTAVYVGILFWWGTIKPRQDRDWAPEVARLPTAVIDDDRVVLKNVRHFHYRSVNDFDIDYEDREVFLSHLTSVDLFVSYWSPGPVGHTFLSFRFDNAPPICISIETRPVVGQGYSPIASLFKQYEITHVVGDERDIVGVRTTHRNEEVYLYPLVTSPVAAKLLFLVYLERINDLAERPEFYHLLKDNCTLNIIRYANAAGREGRFDYRHLLNGWIDRYLYLAGYVNTSLPFPELRQRSQINTLAEEAGESHDFSTIIRREVDIIANTPPQQGLASEQGRPRKSPAATTAGL